MGECFFWYRPTQTVPDRQVAWRATPVHKNSYNKTTTGLSITGTEAEQKTNYATEYKLTHQLVPASPQP